MTSNVKRLRVLALHGLRQDGDLFATKLAGITDGLDPEMAEFVFPHAPFLAHTIDPDARADSDIERSWFDAADSTILTPQALKRIDDAGARGPDFDLVLGFSQGCLAALALVSLKPSDRPPSCKALRAVILIASPNPRRSSPSSASSAGSFAIPSSVLKLPSLHLIGQSDRVVAPDESLALAEEFEAATVVCHPGGHSVPRQSTPRASFREFMLAQQRSEDTVEFERAIGEEISMLEAVFGDALERLPRQPDDNAIAFTLTVAAAASGAIADPVIHMRVPPAYPEMPAAVALLKPDPRSVPWGWRFTSSLQQAAAERTGELMLFDLINVAIAQIEELSGQDHEDTAGSEDPAAAGPGGPIEAWDAIPFDEQATIVAEAYDQLALQSELKSITRSFGGRMKYVIGLVGKPSAGKSTFFNAVTDPASESEAAKIGAFPFTTIDPNYAHAFVGLDCACSSYGYDVSACNAEHGHFPASSSSASNSPVRRRHAILVKDVAGLVPGAYQGKGKGNRFLNDLCDATVLVHVVDGSGSANANGEVDELNPSTPLEDVKWIRHEIHSWIFDNVRAKWEIIRKRPVKLLSMFSGYGAPASLVEKLLESVAGVKPSQLPLALPTWRLRDLHRFVAGFISCRFPTLIAVNKCDHSRFPAHFEAVRARYPKETVAMSAKAELALLQWRRAGHVRYLAGGVPEWIAADTPEPDGFKSILRLIESKRARNGTGVADVLDAAFRLRPSAVVFLSEDLGHGTATSPSTGETAKVLPVAHLMHPASTADDVARLCDESGQKAYARVEYVPVPFVLQGDAKCATGLKLQLKRDVPIPPSMVARIFFR